MPKQELYLGTSQLAASYLGTVASTIYDKEIYVPPSPTPTPSFTPTPTPTPVSAFNPNDISNLTFWVDFSDVNFLTLDGTQTEVIDAFSIVGGSANATLSKVNGSNYRYSYVTSLSNSALRCAKVVNRPTSYRSSKWGNGVTLNRLVQPS
jgi:hypothetical protein